MRYNSQTGKYIASDGKTFDTLYDCRNHEAKLDVNGNVVTETPRCKESLDEQPKKTRFSVFHFMAFDVVFVLLACLVLFFPSIELFEYQVYEAEGMSKAEYQAGEIQRTSLDTALNHLDKFVSEEPDIRTDLNVYTYGEDVEDYDVESVIYYMEILNETLDSFIKDNGMLIVADNYDFFLDRYFNRTATEDKGACYFMEYGRPILIVNNEVFNDDYGIIPKNLIVHEMGHYIDNKLGWISSSGAFQDLFNRYAKDYQAKTHTEFFAILMENMMTGVDEDIKETYPEDLYNFMIEAMRKVGEINRYTIKS